PQANWVEVSPGTPYFIIGESGYSKPLLDRVLRFESSLQLALKIGVLAFDSTRRSATNVDFPIDVIIYRRDTFRMLQHRYSASDLAGISEWWTTNLQRLISTIPSGWTEALFSREAEGKVTPILRQSPDG
ncbi:MAG: peptidase, partial [Actinomycetota bacterium]